MSKHSNTPELRFPEFKDEWKDNELGKLLSIISGHSPSYYSEGSEYPLYKVNDLNNNSKFQNYSDLYVEKKHTPLNKRVIIFPKRGAAILLNKIRIINTPGYIDTNLMGLEFNDVNDTEFYYYAILREGLYRIADTSTIPQINNKHISPYKIYSPGYTEKNKLGNFFSKLDRQIELEEQKLEKLKEQKKGYMQKIFSQELRFKDEKGNDYPEWDITTIEKIAKVSKGFTPSTKDINLWQNDNKNWLSIAGMSDKYIYEGNKGISSAGEGKHKKVNKDTLIMSFKLTLGKLAIVKTPIYTNEAICHFEWKTNQLKTEYMYYYLSFINIKSFGAQAVKGITLNNDSINSIVIKLPGFLEQNKISNFFTKFDELIEKQNQKIDGLKKRKKGFLQKMFV
ncbi:restriction endonuclease subunit S [Staphylococcus chromogenes]|uniref:restriction endonuclease subunit S n=1 Tax=Staphylococcus chromogenes TaxID=46126 RepID=UPI000D1A2438|nr:restriction endonuclease subunit S [Staphylococcus chromogenes]PTF72688.1 restriction endonuclease subunit S [Staphylococcus chromogenes]PTG55341.1 restriction endonuclease subunit S [Staphylococcus chromogenes]